MTPAVFLDRDGTVCEEMGYANDLSRMRVFPFSARAVRRLNRAGFKVVIVTNQAGVAKGYFPESFLAMYHRVLMRLLRQGGARIDAIYHCPHHKAGDLKRYTRDCACRKPRPGMLLAAKRRFRIDLDRSYVVGDKIIDVELGKGVGAKGILVKTGYGAGEYRFHRPKWKVQPDYVARDLGDAVAWILRDRRADGRRA